MKLRCGRTLDEFIQQTGEWHSFFTLIPRRMDDDGTCRWLETIERRGYWANDMVNGFWEWQYRAKRKITDPGDDKNTQPPSERPAER